MFRNARQTCDKTTSAFIVRLCKLAATYEYDCNDEEIRDQFVCSCFDTKLREKFLRMPGFTIEKISELGFLYEQSKAQAKEIADNKETDKEINFV